MINPPIFVVCLAFAALLSPSGALGEVVNLNLATPTFDQWNYPFAGNPGGNTYAAVFAPLTSSGFDPNFDNRDGQMVIGFNTAAAGVTPNLGRQRYHVLSATVRITVESNNTFRYDPTPDSYRNWLPPGHPEYLPDADQGQALEIFGVRFRHGWTPNTYGENTGYSPLGSFGKGIRTAYPISFQNGRCQDVSNNFDQQFESTPFAVGTNANLTPGQLVPANTPFTFAFDVNDPDVRRTLSRALNSGMFDVAVAAIFPSEQQQAGTYPRFYTKENILVLAGMVSAARLELSVQISDGPALTGDVNQDAMVNVNDLLAVINSWGSCPCCAADVNDDDLVNVNDLLLVINTWGS